MALATHVIDRISADRLIPLTNQGAQGAVTVNATRLGNACDDVIAEFKTIGELLYDDTNAQHISVAIRGVMDKLRIWIGQIMEREDGSEPWHALLIKLRNTGPRARIQNSCTRSRRVKRPSTLT